MTILILQSDIQIQEADFDGLGWEQGSIIRQLRKIGAIDREGYLTEKFNVDKDLFFIEKQM